MAMGTTMQTLDTKNPELDRLVLAVVTKVDNKSVNFRYLSKDEKSDLVKKCLKDEK